MARHNTHYRDFRGSHNTHSSNQNRRVSYSQSMSHRRSLSTNSDLSDLSISDMVYDIPPSATPEEDPSVFPDPEKRTKEGFLDYRTSPQRPFKQRYFVLTRNFLLGASSADARKLDKVIHLENATNVGLNDRDPVEFFIRIQQHNKVKKLTFRAESEDETQMWISHVRTATRLSIHDIYHFIEPISFSDFGTRVWRARIQPAYAQRHSRSGMPNDEFVAIKMIEKTMIDKTNLRNEIITMKRLDHPCVVKLYDVFEDKQYLCLIMEYCGGGELYDVVASHRRDETESCDVMHQIARGVRYLHSRSVVHRDLKPENILCLFSPTTGRLSVKIADFGISKAVDRLQTMQTPCGTLTYMAPEILRGEPYDQTCDFWSLGVIMHALVVGYSPWWKARGAPSEIQRMIVRGQVELDPNDWAHVSPEVQNLVLRLLHADPRQRATVEDILSLTWREMVSSAAYSRARKKLKNVARDAQKRRRASTEAFERNAEILRRLYHVRGQSMEDSDLMEWGLDHVGDGEEAPDEYHMRTRTRLTSAELSSTAVVEEELDIVGTPRTPRDIRSRSFGIDSEDDRERSVSPLDGLDE